jgi:hypothetical protein
MPNNQPVHISVPLWKVIEDLERKMVRRTDWWSRMDNDRFTSHVYSIFGMSHMLDQQKRNDGSALER